MAPAAGPQNSGNVNYFFQIIVFLCITFLFGKLDPIAPLTPFGMNTIGVFLGVIYAWVFIDIIWPSMVGLGSRSCCSTSCPQRRCSTRASAIPQSS